MKLLFSALLVISVLVVGFVGYAEALTFDSPRILHEGKMVQQIEVNTKVQFQAKLVNDDSVQQPYVFFRTVNDENGNLDHESFFTGALSSGEIIYLESSWIPENAGSYHAILEIYDNLEKENLLTSPLFLNIEVIDLPIDLSIMKKPIPQWVKGVFAFWMDGQISDDELKEAIRFLVNSGIIIL